MRTFKSSAITITINDSDLNNLICRIDGNLIRLESKTTELLRRPTARLQRYEGEDQFHLTSSDFHVRFVIDVPNKTVCFEYEGTLSDTFVVYDWFDNDAEDLVKAEHAYQTALNEAKAEYTIKAVV